MPAPARLALSGERQEVATILGREGHVNVVIEEIADSLGDGVNLHSKGFEISPHEQRINVIPSEPLDVVDPDLIEPSTGCIL